MDTLKTAAVVVVLLGALYGVYVVLNKPDMVARLLPSSKEKEESPEVQPPRIAPGTHYVPGGVEKAGDELDPPIYPPPGPSDPSVPSPHVPPDGGIGQRWRGGENPEISPEGGNRDDSRNTEPSDDRSPPYGVAPADIHNQLEASWRAAERFVEQGNLRDALAELSRYYDEPKLSDAEQQRLLIWLDSLAGEVIYSTRHLLEREYLVERGDTLEQIAADYEVPAQLLANINGIDSPLLTPGTSLKVVRGPFSAEVDMAQHKLTLFLGNLYAGRFPISSGDEAPPPGKYEVKFKDRGADYYARDGRTIRAGLPDNPYGQYWIDLGGRASLHGSPASSTAPMGLGCISLSPGDAADVYGILTAGSQVTIRR